MIHPLSGLFSWTPEPLTPPGTNAVTVRVTDNGTPPLAATRTFQILVVDGLFLGGATLTPGGDLSFTVGTTPGRIYRAEYKDDLNAVGWMPLGPDRVADATTWTINDTIGANPQRFYRVIQLP
jgi:hypothetical protein